MTRWFSVPSFNVAKNRELLVPRIAREARYLISDLTGWRSRPITPFVVVCRQRTGSNMLRYALETHPQIVHYGELWHERRRAIWGAHGRHAYRPRALLEWSRRDARSFLDEVIYRDAMPPITAVGFKLFYHHGRTDGAGDPWPAISARRDVRVIHLVRANPVASFVSKERMRHAKVYVQMRGAATTGDDHKIELDIAKLTDYLADYAAALERCARELADHDTLELSYEQLTSDPTALDRVQQFLGVAARPLRYQTERQSRGSIGDRIANLDAVRAALRTTRWRDLAL